MSLFSAIQGSSNALRVNQLGLQVVGNNIANVNTPGYIRQELIQAPAVGYKSGGLIIGQGVQAVGIQQKLDNFVIERLRQTQSQLSYQEQLEGTNAQVESLLNELTDKDFSSNLSRFANAFQDVANQPGSDSIRSLAISRGQELAAQLKNLSSSVDGISKRNQTEISSAATDINRIVDVIAKLNQRIVEVEGGPLSNSDAVGLRDERLKVLDELSTYVDVSVREDASGSVTVFVGGDYLVSNGIPRHVKAVTNEAGTGLEIRLADTDAPLKVSGGKLKGLYESADAATSTGFKGKLDSLASDVIRVVNRIHSQGQGQKGFGITTGETVLSNPNAPIERAGASIDIDNGSFTINVHDAKTGKTKSYDIFVKQQGLASDTTPQQLVTAIDAIDGVSAKITNDGRLELKSDSEAIQFSFANDTSGTLAALGINTFFRGNSAATIEVRPDIIADPFKLAVSLNGINNGADNAIKIAEAFTKPTELLGGRSVNALYDEMIASTTREISSQKGVTDGLRNFQQTLEAQHLGISGVNLDEEAVKMLLYQRAFQATSKLVSVASEMLNTLVNLI